MGALALARRHLRGQGARAALTAAGVACGVALMVAIRVINASTLASFTDAIEDLAGTAALQVRGPGPFPETVAEQLRAIPGVDHAVPIVTTTFFGAEPPIGGEALSVFAADVTDGHAIRTLHLVKAGEHGRARRAGGGLSAASGPPTRRWSRAPRGRRRRPPPAPRAPRPPPPPPPPPCAPAPPAARAPGGPGWPRNTEAYNAKPHAGR